MGSLLMLVLSLVSLYFFWDPCCSPFCYRRCDNPIGSAAEGPPPCCNRLHCFCQHFYFWWPLYCVGGPFIPAVACVLAVVSGHDIAVILNVACCQRYCCCYCLHPDCGRYSCCCWLPLSSWGFPVAVLSAIADIPGVTKSVVGVSALHFEHAVTGGPAVADFPAVPAADGVLAVASTPADPGVPILAGGFTYWIVEWDILRYRTMAIGL